MSSTSEQGSSFYEVLLWTGYKVRVPLKVSKRGDPTALRKVVLHSLPRRFVSRIGIAEAQMGVENSAHMFQGKNSKGFN